MRVLVLTNMYPTPEEPWFGCFVREQVEDLIELGIEADVLHFDGRGTSSAYARIVPALRRRVAGGHFDLVHAHYGLSGAVALTQRRVPVVTTFHGSDAYVRWQRCISWAVARSTTPIFVSRRSAEQLAQRGAIIPVGVDTRLFSPIDREEARKRLRWEEGRRYVLFPGATSNPCKRYDLFQAVVERARAVIPELESVALEGYAREDVALVLNAVDVTLMTSDREGSPATVRESLAVATPVVSVPVGDVEERLAGLPGCSVCPRDAERLSEGLLAALAAPRDQVLRERAEQTSRESVARRIASLYRELLERTS